MCQISVGGVVFKYDEFWTKTAIFTTLHILLLKTNIYYTPATVKLHDNTVQVSSAQGYAEYAEKIDGTKMYIFGRLNYSRHISTHSLTQNNLSGCLDLCSSSVTLLCAREGRINSSSVKIMSVSKKTLEDTVFIIVYLKIACCTYKCTRMWQISTRSHEIPTYNAIHKLS